MSRFWFLLSLRGHLVATAAISPQAIPALLKTRYQFPLRGNCARARPRSPTPNFYSKVGGNRARSALPAGRQAARRFLATPESLTGGCVAYPMLRGWSDDNVDVSHLWFWSPCRHCEADCNRLWQSL